MKNLAVLLLGISGLALSFAFVPSLNKQVRRGHMNVVCSLGSAEKCARLAHQFKKPEDIFYLIEGTRKACRIGHAQSCLTAGINLEGIQKLEPALAAYTKGCELNHEKSCGESLIMLMALNRWTEALNSAKTHCQAGMASLCRGWGLLGYQQKMLDEAYAGFYFGCYTHKDYESCYRLGEVFYRKGQMNYAFNALTKACSNQHERACLSMESIRLSQATMRN